MMNGSPKRFLIVGRTNVGKTLFMLNFAEYMGYDNLTVKLKNNIDETLKNGSTIYLKKNLVNDNPNTTKCLQILKFDIPVFKGKKQAEFIDTTGVSSSIHFDQDVREGMVQTLTLLKENNIILHILDSASIAGSKKIDDIDTEIYKYGRKRGNYLILANKIDLHESCDGLKLIDDNFPDVRIIRVSALHKSGFSEIKKYVSKII